MLNLRRGPGAYALLSRADGQLTRAGQHYYSHLGLRPPSRDFDYNQPLIHEGPNDYILLRNGRTKLVRSLQFWCEDLREARRQLMAVGESP